MTARPLLCRVDVAMLPPVSLLPRERLSVSVCTRPSRDLFCCSRSTFSDRRFFAFLDDSFFTSLALSLDSLRAAWHWLTVDLLLCSRDLENLLSHLIPACDSVDHSLCGLVLVVVYGSLECCWLGWNVVSVYVPQHVHQESHIPRPKLGLTFHHELPPGLEPFVHAGSVTFCPTRLLHLSSSECSTSVC